MAVIGFLLFGPDMLVSAAAAMDLADQKQTATVIGFVNGVGAIGAALSGVVNGALAEQDWNYVFYVLIGMVAIAAAITSLLWRQGGQRR